MIGKTLSHYKVIEKIGQGGMGEVYRAEDTNLSRDVAIKVLPEQFTKDPQRLARFEREAKLLAQLNHPNIAAIYGFEKAEGVHFLALELVPGETLAEKVAKGPLPVEEALEICRQIAEGVEAAHAKGVIHRDLKPANVKVTPEGKVKILDFGLAKAFEEETPVTDISQSPTLTEEMTRAGVILGTAAYMSPEQAKGEAVDKRADVFAFGCVLYELLTGKRTFDGKTITETLGAIIHKEPEWEALPATTPWRIQELLRRCLTKDAHDRLRDIANVRIEVKLALSEPTAVSPTGVVSTAQPPLWRRAIPWTVALLMGVIAISIAFWSSSSPTLPSLRKLVITPSSTTPLGNRRFTDLAISPDGSHVVYFAGVGMRGQLYVRAMDDLTAAPLPGTEGVDRDFFFSSDGEWVAFVVGNKLKKVSLAGGAPITLCDVRTFEGGSWGSENTIVFAGNLGPVTGLYRVSANGGQPESLAMPDIQNEYIEYQQPEFLPGSKAVLFAVVRRAQDNYQIAVLSLDTGEQKTLLENGRQPHYLPTGHLVYELTQTGTLMAVPFDLERLELSGEPVPVFEGVRSAPGEGTADYSISDDGTVVYVSGGSAGQENVLVWVDRNGATQQVTEMQRDYGEPRFSPDGRRLALTIGPAGNLDVWIYDINSGILAPFTFDATDSARARWSPDGKRLAFSSDREGVLDIYWNLSDGSGEIEKLTASGNPKHLSSWSSQGVLAYSESDSGWDIRVLALEGERKPIDFLAGRLNQRNPVFSPDGRWIALSSNHSGQYEIYVKSYADQGGTIQISIDGGQEPMWAPDGKELFYRNGDQMMVVSVGTAPTFQAQTPRLLFEGSYKYDSRDAALSSVSNYDISPDGQRFVMVKETEVQEAKQIHVVLNWFEELKRLVPTN